MFFKAICSLVLCACLSAQAVEIVSLEGLASDSRFQDDVAARAVDEPTSFEFAGLYASEAPTAKKEVVLFIHGIAGHPGNWATMAQSLDTQRFQAWFVYYASGNDLTDSATKIAQEVTALAKAHGIPAVHVVSHSMGGLVAWKVADRLSDALRVEQLVSVATPWNGHWASRLGVWFSRNPPEAWRSLVPDNRFLQAIWAAKNRFPHKLVHAVKNENAGSDGTISAASQTVPEMVHKADVVLQLIADHMSVIEDNRNAKAILALL